MLHGHTSTRPYRQLFLEVTGMLLATKKKKKELKDVSFYLGPSLYLLLYVEYIATNCLQYMTSFFLLQVMNQHLDIRENSV